MTDSSSIFEAYYRAFAREIATFERARQQVRLAKTIADAEGRQLDRLATIFQLERRTGESDALFRVRIQTFFRAALVSGTLPEIGETIESLLGSLNGVALTDTGTAEIQASVLGSVLADSDFTTQEFFSEVEKATAAGVTLVAIEEGTFQFTAESAPVVSDHGFAELDSAAVDGESTRDDIVEGTGGKWSDIVQG